MAFVPQAVGHTDLEYPKDKWRIALLPLDAKEAWYAAQSPQSMIGRKDDFEKFWKFWYLGHVKLKRFVFKIRFNKLFGL